MTYLLVLFLSNGTVVFSQTTDQCDYIGLSALVNKRAVDYQCFRLKEKSK